MGTDVVEGTRRETGGLKSETLHVGPKETTVMEEARKSWRVDLEEEDR